MPQATPDRCGLPSQVTPELAKGPAQGSAPQAAHRRDHLRPLAVRPVDLLTVRRAAAICSRLFLRNWRPAPHLCRRQHPDGSCYNQPHDEKEGHDDLPPGHARPAEQPCQTCQSEDDNRGRQPTQIAWRASLVRPLLRCGLVGGYLLTAMACAGLLV